MNVDKGPSMACCMGGTCTLSAGWFESVAHCVTLRRSMSGGSSGTPTPKVLAIDTCIA